MTTSLHSRPAVRALAASCFALLAGCAVLQDHHVLSTCATPLPASVENGCVVAAQALWRGAKPDSIAAATLVELGVKTVVNLELLHDDKQAFADARISLTDRREVTYFRVRDWEPLVAIAPAIADDHVAHFMAITRTQPPPLYVHCRAGKNRTGVMVAAYRVLNGMPAGDAIAEMKGYGGKWFKHDADYIRGLTPQRREELEQRIAQWIPKLRRDARIVCTGASCAVLTP